MAKNVLLAIGGKALVDNPRFGSNADRRVHVEELDRLIADWCAERDRTEVLEVLTFSGCAVGPLETVPSMMRNPQVMHRGSIVTVEDADLGPVSMTGVYPRFLSAPTDVGEPGRSESRCRHR